MRGILLQLLPNKRTKIGKEKVWFPLPGHRCDDIVKTWNGLDTLLTQQTPHHPEFPTFMLLAMGKTKPKLSVASSQMQP